MSVCKNCGAFCNDDSLTCFACGAQLSGFPFSASTFTSSQGEYYEEPDEFYDVDVPAAAQAVLFDDDEYYDDRASESQFAQIDSVQGISHGSVTDAALDTATTTTAAAASTPAFAEPDASEASSVAQLPVLANQVQLEIEEAIIEIDASGDDEQTPPPFQSEQPEESEQVPPAQQETRTPHWKEQAEAHNQVHTDSRRHASGVLALAVYDITNTAGWFTRVLVLALISCIPILNFYSIGYCLRWGAVASIRSTDKMSRHVFLGPNFKYGFLMAFFMFMVMCTMSIFNLIPYVGNLFVVLVLPVGLLCVLRATVRNKLSESFGLIDAIKKYCSNPVGLMGVVFAPVCACIVLSAVVLLLAGFVSGASLFGVIYGYIPMITPRVILGIVIAWVLLNIVSIASQMVLYRELGYWVSRFAPDWVG